VLVAALVAPSTIEAVAGGGPWRGVDPGAAPTAWCEGTPLRAVEKAAETAVLRDVALPPYREALFALFGAAPKAVVPGRDGWLFFHDHVAGYPGPEAAFLAESAGRLAAALSDHCADLGTLLLAVPVPNKETIVRDRFAPATVPPGELYGPLLRAWRRRGVRVVDLRPPLAADPASAWLRTDTHWTFAGARASAAVAAEALRDERDRGDFGPREATEFRASPPAPYRGDLFALLGFRPAGPFGPMFTEHTAAILGFGADGTPAADRVARPLVVAGSSAAARFGFAAALGAELGVRVEDRSADAAGFCGTLFALLREIDAGLRLPPRAIVWEFVERTVRYEAAANRAELAAWLTARGASPAYARQGAAPLASSDGREFVTPPGVAADGSFAFSAVLAAALPGQIELLAEDATGTTVFGPAAISVDATPRRRTIPLGPRRDDSERTARTSTSGASAGEAPAAPVIARLRLRAAGDQAESSSRPVSWSVVAPALRAYRP
jgi:alginate O-acetyltransferase complex protein AlgJ